MRKNVYLYRLKWGMAAGKTSKSILVSCGARLAPFDIKELREITAYDELAVMDGGKCIVQICGVRPFLSDKYDLTQHPNYYLTAGADKRNWFDVGKYLDHKVELHPDDVYEVIEV